MLPLVEGVLRCLPSRNIHVVHASGIWQPRQDVEAVSEEVERSDADSHTRSEQDYVSDLHLRSCRPLTRLYEPWLYPNQLLHRDCTTGSLPPAASMGAKVRAFVAGTGLG